MIEPKIDDLLAAVDSKYTLVILAAKRAREINSYYSQLGEGRGEFVPPLVESGLQQQAAVDRPRGDRRGQDRVRAARGARRGRVTLGGPPGPARRHRRHRRLQGRPPRPAADRRRGRGHGRDDRGGRRGSSVPTRSPRSRGARRTPRSGSARARCSTSGSPTRPIWPSSRRRPRNLLAKLAHGHGRRPADARPAGVLGPGRGRSRDAHGDVGAPRDPRQRGACCARAASPCRRTGRRARSPTATRASAAWPSPRRSSRRLVDRGPASLGRAPGDLAGRRGHGHGGADARADRPGPVPREPLERPDGRRGRRRGARARRARAPRPRPRRGRRRPPGVDVVHVATAEEMRAAVLARVDGADAVVMAAAVADFRPKRSRRAKLKKEHGLPELVLEPTPDILAELGGRADAGSGAGRVRRGDRRRRGGRPREARGARASTSWWRTRWAAPARGSAPRRTTRRSSCRPATTCSLRDWTKAELAPRSGASSSACVA